MWEYLKLVGNNEKKCVIILLPVKTIDRRHMIKYYKNYYFENIKNCLIIIMILSIFVILSIVNYKLGIGYCEVSDIPLDFILPTSGIPISIGIPIVLFFF